MNFNKFLKSLFGDKSTRDMKLIQPLGEKVKAVSPKIEQLDNDALRARSKEIREQVQAKATEQRARIAELKATPEELTALTQLRIKRDSIRTQYEALGLKIRYIHKKQKEK